MEISRTNKDWNITIAKETLVPAQVYRTFCIQVQEKMSHIAKITFRFQYSEQIQPGDIISEYWKLFLEWVHREIPSVNGWMNRAVHEWEDGLLLLTMSDSMSLELARKKQIDQAIIKFYDKYFGLSMRIKVQVGESNQEALQQFQEKKMQEEREVIQQMMESMESKCRLWMKKKETYGFNLVMTSKNRLFRCKIFRTKRKSHLTRNNLRFG